MDIPNEELEKITRLCRRTWKTHVLRYAQVLPAELYCLDPLSLSFKRCLKDWVLNNIPKDGDHIFQGKIHPPKNKDWLTSELEAWKERELNDWQSLHEMEMIQE